MLIAPIKSLLISRSVGVNISMDPSKSATKPHNQTRRIQDLQICLRVATFITVNVINNTAKSITKLAGKTTIQVTGKNQSSQTGNKTLYRRTSVFFIMLHTPFFFNQVSIIIKCKNITFCVVIFIFEQEFP